MTAKVVISSFTGVLTDPAQHNVPVTPEQMAAVKVPTLGIVGTLDHTLKAMQNLKALLPDMKLVLLEGISHTGKTGIQNQPALVAEIRTFITEQRRPAATGY